MSKTVTRINNQLKEKTDNPIKASQSSGLKGLINQMKPAIKAALTGTALAPERFTRLLFSTISFNPKLEACTPESFAAAMMQAAQLGLEPNTSLGEAYLIPYGNKVQFQVGYQGLITLAYRSNMISEIDAQVVYENDFFEYELGMNKKLIHKPALNDRGDPIAYYATFHMPNGGGNFLVMSQEDVLNHAKRFSKTFNNGPWQTDFTAMAKKTVLKQLLKYAPLSPEFKQAVQADETVKSVEIEEANEINVLEVPAEFEVEDSNNKVSDDEITKLQKELSQEKIF